ncbi:hypothetical protein, partial [Streptomyces sp. NPDC014805]|uniref:hypothetical protein n=1 Tax=Streptomyces sp. NPDC014805 TaxID=3364919 RepID=UPI0037015CAC
MAVGLFLVADGDAAPLLEAVEAGSDDVAAPVDGSVEAAGPSAASASARDLVDAFGDGRLCRTGFVSG